MAALLGTVRNYTCRYVDKRTTVTIITNHDVILSVPVHHRESSDIMCNAVLAFVCPGHARAVLYAERAAGTPRATEAQLFEVTVNVLHEFAKDVQMPTLIITGGHCDLPFGPWNGRGPAVWDLSYMHPPSTTTDGMMDRLETGFVDNCKDVDGSK
jgi:hypothetical protein